MIQIATINNNPYNKTDMISVWREALGLSMGPINKDRVASGLPELRQTDASLTEFAQLAADQMVRTGRFVEPNFTTRKSDTLVVAMKLSGKTRINEYAFIINDSKYFYIELLHTFIINKIFISLKIILVK